MGIDESSTNSETTHAAVLIPIKAFRQAKMRLADVLSPDDRQSLAKRMATQVINASGTLAAYVVCDDEEVAKWSQSQGAQVIWTPGLGLNGAIEKGVETLAEEGAQQVIVSHADLPMAVGLADLLNNPANDITLVPDRRRDGTNVAVVPALAGFHFSYGPGSFHSHCEEAARLGLTIHINESPSLTLDVDLPSDLALLPPTWSLLS
ncbi:MAG: 2-phospho-L-lactate guanylyltransferase [Acidimicrobiales bacterium]